MLEKIKEKIKQVIAKEEAVDTERKLYNYWMTNVKRAKKAQPTDDWDAAKKRYAIKQNPDETGDNRPFVNDTRKHHEASMAFLDQQSPSFKVVPSEAFMGDPTAEKEAECDAVYLKKIWHEQKCQKVQSRKLNSALLNNDGFSLVQFDVKKWMPNLRYLSAKNILLDPDCEGVEENAGWKGYEDDIPPEDLKAMHPDMSKEEFKEILKSAGSTLTEKQRESLDEGDRGAYSSIKIIHIFARNAAALKTKEEEETEERPLPKRLAEELQLDTPRRYLQFIKGYPKPIVDEPIWPLDLDHDEFPTTHLQFNQVPDETYGFTDHKQMERMDELSDAMMRDLGIASFWAAVSKFAAASTSQIDPVDLDDFLNNPKTSFLADMLDIDGNPKLKALERGRIEPAQIQLYNLVHDQAKEASAMSELLENADIQAAKDVTALGMRIVDANMHQRVNRRLGGPWGYEQSIAEDAIKMLEVAHQFVPKFSQVAVMTDFPVLNEFEEPMLDETGEPITEQKEDLQDLPWPQALKAIEEGGDLIKLGADAIVGQELAQYWQYKQPPEQWRLSTKVTVEPGTTRTITEEQRTAIMKQLYVEVFSPFYSATQRVDLMRQFLEMIGRAAKLPNIDSLIPKADEAKAQTQQMQQSARLEQAEKSIGQAGGQPLNTAEANVSAPTL